MFGKILRAGKGGHGLKYKIDVQITQLENLPTTIKKCRVVWARSAKVQITDVKDVRGSVASFKQVLTQVTTMYKDKSGKFELKEYEFKVQVPGKSSTDALVTIGKATLDMAKYCSDQTTTQNAMLPITFKVGGTTTGYLKMLITSVFLGDAADDGMTEVSGMTGLTSDHGSIREQDLDGFGDEEHAKYNRKTKSRREDATSSSPGASSRSGKPESRGSRHKPLPPMAEEGASDLEEEPESSPSPVKASRKKPPAQDAASEDNPFARKVPRQSAKKPPPKVWDDDEDVSPLNSDISDSETPPAKAKPKSKEPEEPLDDMKAALFATKKAAGAPGSAAAGGPSTSKAAVPAGGKAGKGGSAPLPQDEDEDLLRDDLFTTKPSSKPNKPAPAPPPPDEDEDALRDDLFTAKPKASAAAKPGKKSSGGAAAAPDAAPPISRAKPKAAPPAPPDNRDDYEDDYGPSTSSAPAPVTTSKARTRSTELPEASAGKGALAMARSGSSKGDSGKGGSSTELEQLRKRVEQLEDELAVEQVAKEDLNKKLQKYVDKIAELEDQLAEGDAVELYAQMKEMEAKYQVEIKELMDRHLAEIAELEDRHQADISRVREEAASSSGRGANGLRDEELRRLEAELREQEASLKARAGSLEAEHAAADAARKAAEAKLAEANKMIDDSLLVATKHQQENKALNEEIARLKRQLEDASMWDTSRAVAAGAASNGGRRSSEAEAEVEELRERVAELQEEVTRLQKLNEAAEQAAGGMMDDISALLGDLQGIHEAWSTTASGSLEQLAVGVLCLCSAYTTKSTELREAEARLRELSGQAAAPSSSASGVASQRTKPHELLSRVQQLTAERDALLEQAATSRQAAAELAVAQQLIASLRQQVAQLAAEKEAVENFKVATIADLRRQNDELRSSLRSLSPAAVSPARGTLADDGEASNLPTTPAYTRAAPSTAARLAAAAGGGDGNWQEFESLMSQLKADRADLRQRVEQLKAEKAALERQVADLRHSGAVASAVGGLRAPSSLSPQQLQRLEELEVENSQLQAELVRLQAQVAELSEADTVIKEWSDYADGLVADKARLEEQVQQLLQQLDSGGATAMQLAQEAESRAHSAERRALSAEQRAEHADQRAMVAERKAADAEEKADCLERKAEAADQRAEDAERAAVEARIAAQLAQQRASDAERRADVAEQQANAFERRAVDAESRASEAARAAVVAQRRAVEAEQRVAVTETRAADAERKAEEAAAAAAEHSYGVSAAAGAMLGEHAAPWSLAAQQYPQPADTSEVMELRHEIARLEASLSGLRVQLAETQSRSVSVTDDIVSSLPAPELNVQSDRRDSRGRETRAFEVRMDDDAGSSDASTGASTRLGPLPRGWDVEVEQLRARNASLEATVAGLQASLAAVLAEAGGSDDGRHYREAEMQIEDLRAQLAQALQAKAELEGTVALLRSELERVPLVSRASGSDTHDDEPDRRASDDTAPKVSVAVAAALDDAELHSLRQQLRELQGDLTQLQSERSTQTATLASFRAESRRLQEEKADAEATISRLSAEMEELAEALDAANNENERLSLEVLGLRDQLEALEGERPGSDAGASTRRSTDSSGSNVATAESLQLARDALAAAERQLAAARAEARELKRQLSAGSGGGAILADDPDVNNQEDLAEGLKELRAKIVELRHQSRLRRQSSSDRASGALKSAAAIAAEAQLAKATARIDELEQLLEDAEIENQHLTEQLEECLTGGRRGPDSVGSVAEEVQSSYGGSAAAGATGTSAAYSYGHANTLTLSAFEQRLAMAEGRRDELSAALEEAVATNRRLETEMTALQQQLVAGRQSGGYDAFSDFDRPPSQVPPKARASRLASDHEEGLKKRIEELQAANSKLEAVCDDLEDKARGAQERAEALEAEHRDAGERIRGLEAALASANTAMAALQRRIEEEGCGPTSRQAKEKLADLEQRATRLSREKVALEDQLAEERAARQELEETLKDKLDRAGDDEAAETVAAFEVKYNRLKERYKILEESSQEELDELQDQLTEAQAQVTDLQRQVKQLQSQLAQNRSAGAAASSAANMEELRSLRAENEKLVQQLVAKTMELAEQNEAEITIKRELARLREVNMKLAQKATSLEAAAATLQAQQAAANNAKADKKGGKK